ncbi:hypothetical protein BU24DRAFT_419906 [Aaosphaeria arxii CBS 175.79]|uniref:Uncharacterized protein n=1 Tax=Aaosphaeria arxii CBS 175.79 TaxID=1450172 RepID=A0A6A5XVW8_9PLEO|nr:uncharacterized protein BU24DRAFT_419906 [Aaosphaeria arxii CBS 175.79]KAF2016851.1 hypothetical protein BU24DRAFT_419906 [Aaosphaeria arxii CBS 175.79]
MLKVMKKHMPLRTRISRPCPLAPSQRSPTNDDRSNTTNEECTHTTSVYPKLHANATKTVYVPHRPMHPCLNASEWESQTAPHLWLPEIRETDFPYYPTDSLLPRNSMIDSLDACGLKRTVSEKRSGDRDSEVSGVWGAERSRRPRRWKFEFTSLFHRFVCAKSRNCRFSRRFS